MTAPPPAQSFTGAARPIAPPPLRAMLAEARASAELVAFFRGREGFVASAPRGSGAPVFVLPGFLSSDLATAPLRGVLADLGHAAHGWRLGRNLGLRSGVFDAVERRLLSLAGRYGVPVAVVGWSLGGLYACELAHRQPAAVRRVVTLGSPVSGDLKANRAWRLYERIAGHPIERPPIDHAIGAPPPAPLTAIWSPGDGIVAPAAARARPGPQVENVRVEGSHCGLAWNLSALRVVAERLAA